MEPAVYLCDVASLPGAERAFVEANALPRLKELLWLLAPFQELQIIIAECLLCTLHRLVDAHSQYRCANPPPPLLRFPGICQYCSARIPELLHSLTNNNHPTRGLYGKHTGQTG